MEYILRGKARFPNGQSYIENLQFSMVPKIRIFTSFLLAGAKIENIRLAYD